MSDTEIKVPEKLERLMYALIKHASENSFIDFCEHWGIEEKDFEEIKEWFVQFGITQMYL